MYIVAQSVDQIKSQDFLRFLAEEKKDQDSDDIQHFQEMKKTIYPKLITGRRWKVLAMLEIVDSHLSEHSEVLLMKRVALFNKYCMWKLQKWRRHKCKREMRLVCKICGRKIPFDRMITHSSLCKEMAEIKTRKITDINTSLEMVISNADEAQRQCKIAYLIIQRHLTKAVGQTPTKLSHGMGYSATHTSIPPSGLTPSSQSTNQTHVIEEEQDQSLPNDQQRHHSPPPIMSLSTGVHLRNENKPTPIDTQSLRNGYRKRKSLPLESNTFFACFLTPELNLWYLLVLSLIVPQKDDARIRAGLKQGSANNSPALHNVNFNFARTSFTNSNSNSRSNSIEKPPAIVPGSLPQRKLSKFGKVATESIIQQVPIKRDTVPDKETLAPGS